MKILQTDIESLTAVQIKAGMLHLIRGNLLYTQRIDPSRQSAPVFSEGKVTWDMETNIGTVKVLGTALEWQVSRESNKKSVSTIQTIKNFLTQQSCCGGN